MPSLPNRYAHSALKEANTEPVLMLGESVPALTVKCARCGKDSKTYQCSPCAAIAVGETVSAEIRARFYTPLEMEAVA